MSETTTERRLRVMVQDARLDALLIDDGEIDAIVAGREALALLRELEPACYNAPSWTAWKAQVASLLARCAENT